MIDTQTLRKQVLSFAVIGKLSETKKTDTPVSIKLKQYIPMMDIGLDNIPSTWKYCKFDDVLINRDSERIPLSVSERKKLDKVYNYYGASGVIDKVDRYIFDGEYLLIGEDGANLLSRSTPIAFIAKGKYWVNNHAHILEATEHVVLEFVEFVINSMSLVPFVTGAAQPKLSQKMMNQIAIPVPPIEEQKRIVKMVNNIFAKLAEIDELQQQYANNITSLNKKILDLAVRGELVPQDQNDEPASVLLKKIAEEKQKLIKEGKIKKQKALPAITEDEIPFDIPESWAFVRLGEVIELLSGIDYKPSEYSDISGKTVYITGASCLSDTGVIEQRWTDTPKNIAYRGDLLLVCKGSGYGKTVICDVDEAHIARQIMAIKKIGNLNLSYIKYFLQSKISEIKSNGQGVIPGIDRGSVLNMILPLPPLEEQQRIVDQIDRLNDYVEGLRT